MEKKVEQKKKVFKISSTGRLLKPPRKLLTSSDDESKRPKKKFKSSQSTKRMTQEIDRLRLIVKKFENTEDDKIYVSASDNNDPEVIMCEKTKETLSTSSKVNSAAPITEENKKVSKTSSTGTISKPLTMTSSDKESKRPNKSKSDQSVKHMKQELNRLRLMTKNLENSGGEKKCVNESEKENISNTFKKLNDSEVITYKNSHFSSQMEVDTPCTKTKDEELLELGSDTEFAPDANESLDENTDENNSPSMLDSRPYLRKRSRLAFYPVKNNANATENSATTLVNNTSESSEDVIYPSPTQSPTLASKVKQFWIMSFA
ncbi:uncharacterized protein LOC112468653 [Temnothorax curvispinosus]|uniref:Uncharacterized protein LOC112468653 n=1 Tax=Temnothorax curvispinosus TaxID=300111 RepID=A0A6J1RG17_9HYME|nr:uncharacterized protein LOC112468653 [Temnothorax curvispinosus]